MRTMKALIKPEKAPGLVIQDVPFPSMGDRDVLIKIKKASICGTDLSIFKWTDWAHENVKTPLIVGHEFVGEIVDTGKDVKDFFKIGDRVSGENHIACTYCRNCRRGEAHLCRQNVSFGVNTDGCFAEYMAIPAANAYLVPNEINDDVAAILNPLGNAVHTALHYDLVGEDVLITGAGPIGLMAAEIARHAGARHIVITDINQKRLDFAKHIKGCTTVNSSTTSLKEVMRSLNMREGFDVGLEMSGHPNALQSMIDVMKHAGNIALLGILPNDTRISWTDIIFKGLTLKGIYGRKMFETWYKMITMLESGLKVDQYITHHFKAESFQQAFDALQDGQALKIILEWGT